MPLLLWNGKQRLLAIGAISHFLNALVTFVVSLCSPIRPIAQKYLLESQGFVVYIPVGPYLALELLLGGMHAYFTVVGVFSLQQPAIRLEDLPDREINGKATAVQNVIPPPSRQEIIKLGIIAAVLSLAASVPLNFFPKWPL